MPEDHLRKIKRLQAALDTAQERIESVHPVTEQLVLKIQTLQARIEEMHDENSLVYEKLNEARERLVDGRDDRFHPATIALLTDAMGILHGYTNPKLTPPKEGN